MQLKLIALLAFASEALAAAMANDNPPAGPPAPTPPPPNQGEILRILLTALPPTLLNIALTNQPEVSSIIASEFNAGVTDSWFKALPTPVQQYLVNQGKSGAAVAPTTPGFAPSPTSPSGAPFTNVSTPSGTMATTPMIMSSINTSMSMPKTSTFTASETGTSSLLTTPETTPTRNQTSSTAGAMPLPLPTAAIGAGVAGAIGIMGMLGF